MTCEPLIGKDGKVYGFICSRRRDRVKCCVCQVRPAVRLCDYPLRGTLAGATCDRLLCAACARAGTPKQPKTLAEMADTYDLCPAHARLEDKEQ